MSPTVAFWSRFQEYRMTYPLEREGQSLFNVFAELYPEKAKPLIATDLDPFYDDAKVGAFLDYLTQELR